MRWLLSEGTTGAQTLSDLDVGLTPYPIPPDVGAGGFEMVELALGMSVFRAVHTFLPAAAGRLVPLMRARSTMRETSLMVQKTRSGLVLHRENYPRTELTFGEGRLLFRHAHRIDVVPVLDASHDSEMISVTIGDSVLARLLGEGEALALLKALGIGVPPVVNVRPIPRLVSSHLGSSLSTRLTGLPRKLFAQARILDFPAALQSHLDEPPAPAQGRGRLRETVVRLHADLAHLEGKVPTLDELAREHGHSARALNDAFRSEYGCSIVAHVSRCRLDEAKAALSHTDVPMKTLALRLGYSHVNHFISAFRRQFGVTPGSLRRSEPRQAHGSTSGRNSDFA